MQENAAAAGRIDRIKTQHTTPAKMHSHRRPIHRHDTEHLEGVFRVLNGSGPIRAYSLYMRFSPLPLCGFFSLDLSRTSKSIHSKPPLIVLRCKTSHHTLSSVGG